MIFVGTGFSPGPLNPSTTTIPLIFSKDITVYVTEA